MNELEALEQYQAMASGTVRRLVGDMIALKTGSARIVVEPSGRHRLRRWAEPKVRERCRAHNRRGEPCHAHALPGKAVCKHHGGLSTGPKTAEGRQAIADSNRRRRKAWNRDDIAEMRRLLGPTWTPPGCV